jgi:toxin ParE1/3/4
VIFIRPGVHADLDEAEDWYRNVQAHLIESLNHDFDDTVQRIADAPRGFPVAKRGARRVRMKIFPYYILYVIRGDDIIIISLDHVKRHPRAWRKKFRERL